MPVAVTSLGTNSTNGGTATVTFTGLNIPAGSLIVVAAYERNLGGFGVFTDTSGNTWNQVDVRSNSTGTNGVLGLFYAFNSNVLSGGTITYTKGDSTRYAAISGLYATGIISASDPLDTNTPSGTSFTNNNPSNTLVTTARNELAVFFVGWTAGAGDAFTQAAGFISPLDTLINSGAGTGIAGGYAIADLGFIDYESFLNNSRTWTVQTGAFFSTPAQAAHDDVQIGMAETF